MSNNVTDRCRPLQMPPSQKAVLMALADFANDSGQCWPSIRAICEWTCYSERAVRNAIRQLEAAGHIACEVSRGRTSSLYTITPNPAGDAAFNPASDDNPAYGAGSPTRHLTTSTRQQVPPTRQEMPPTRQQVPPNHQEPPRTTNKATKRKAPADAAVRPDEVSEQVWADWLSLRKAKKAPVTPTVLRNALSEATKAGLPLERFLEIWCLRGSQGLQADWLKPNERAGPQTRPSASANFRGKTYAGTPIDQLPPDLRDAARAAVGDG